MRFVPQILPPPCHWCPFVSIRGSYSFRHFVPFVLSVVQIFFSVHSCAFVVHIFPSFRAFRVFRAFRGSNVFLVSIRVHSWFSLSHRARPRAPSTRYLLLPIPYEKPFVSIRGSYLSPSFRAFRCIRRAQEWWPTGFAFPGSGLKSLDVPPIPAASNPRGHHYEQTNQIR